MPNDEVGLESEKKVVRSIQRLKKRISLIAGYLHSRDKEKAGKFGNDLDAKKIDVLVFFTIPFQFGIQVKSGKHGGASFPPDGKNYNSGKRKKIRVIPGVEGSPIFLIDNVQNKTDEEIDKEIERGLRIIINYLKRLPTP